VLAFSGFFNPNLSAFLRAGFAHLSTIIAIGLLGLTGISSVESMTRPKSRAGSGYLVLLTILILGDVAGALFIESWIFRLALSIAASLLVIILTSIGLRSLSHYQEERQRVDIVDGQLDILTASVGAAAPDINRAMQAAMRSVAGILELSSAAVFRSTPEASVQSFRPMAAWPESIRFDATDTRFASEAQSKRGIQRAVRGNGVALALPLPDADGRALAVLFVTSDRNINNAEETVLNGLVNYLARMLSEDSNRPQRSQQDPISRMRLIRLAAGELSEQRDYFQSVFQSMSEGIIIAGLDGLIQFANQNAIDLLHTTERKLVGKHLLDLIGPNKNWSMADLREDLLIVLTSGQPLVRETTIRMPLPRHYQIRVAPICDASMRISGLIIVFSDINRLKELDQAKNEVMSLVSHELRTPLTAIRGYSELLKETPNLPEGAEECVNTIHEAAERLARILTTFLDVSRLESGKQEIRTDPIRLNEVAREAVMLMRPVAQAKSIRLIEDLPQSAPVVAADRDLIAQVITNLISNAIKYSPEKTTVTISLDIDINEQRLGITDQGYGIPPEAREMIWEKFYRIERESDRDTVGTGLGLSFVREIVRKHGGDVNLSSEVGRGSTFSFSIPRL
jgi:PAS domain S-box-containing protein